MNAKLTPGLLLIALLIATAIGPLTALEDVKNHPELITDSVFWRDLGATAISGFATGAVALLSLLGTTLGLPALFERWSTSEKATDSTP